MEKIISWFRSIAAWFKSLLGIEAKNIEETKSVEETESVKQVENAAQTPADSLDDLFKDKIAKYQSSKEKMLERKEELLEEKYSKDLFLDKLNFSAVIEVLKFRKPIYFPQEFADALSELTHEEVNVKDISYAQIVSKRVHCCRIDEKYCGYQCCVDLAKYWKAHCLIYKHYALILYNNFSTLLYIDTDEINVEKDDKADRIRIGAGSHAETRLACIKEDGIEIYRIEMYGYKSLEHRGKTLYSNFNNPSNEDVTEKIKEFALS